MIVLEANQLPFEDSCAVWELLFEMIRKKKNGQASPIVSVILALGVGFATYNVFVILFHRKDLSSGRFLASDSSNRRASARYHVVMTAEDTIYNKWQSRIMYYYYNKIKVAPGSDMGGFTRILHSGKPDNLMDEIPTFIVDPLPEGMDKGYVVLNRPWAFVQWLEKAVIEEEYILMAEPDHIFVNPIPNLAQGDHPAAYPFFYIRILENAEIMRKYYPSDKGPLTNIDPIGNSPSIIKKTLLKEIAPTWMNVSIRMKNDKETDEAFGWVLEMYGYAVASALHNVRHILRKDFMVQPPLDRVLDRKFIIHYTYGCAYIKGKMTVQYAGEWHFNKRHYYQSPPPRNLSLPPHRFPETVVQLVERVNEASANIPEWDNNI